MIITKKNLYKNGRCRFCDTPKEFIKHIECWHGWGDMLGSRPLDLEFFTKKQAMKLGWREDC